MTQQKPMTIFLGGTPGLEQILVAEAKGLGFRGLKPVAGGVEFQGDWTDVWRANLELRGATRVLVRLGGFMALHLAQLDKRAKKFPWGEVLRPDVPVRVEVVTRKSKIYHAGAAQERVERGITESLGASISAEAEVVVKVRIEDNRVTISLDTSGESLHKRGNKPAVGKAPMRETLAALFLKSLGFDGSQAVLDPMCGSGTFVIEAAEMALGLQAGRSRRFAFEQFATFDQDMFAGLAHGPTGDAEPVFYGSDRNAGAIENASKNAESAGVAHLTRFTQAAISDLQRPECAPGLIVVNPPYGSRIGNKKQLFGLYGAMGQKFKEDFAGWKVGIITSDTNLARATGLPGLKNGPPIPHGGLKVRLFESQL